MHTIYTIIFIPRAGSDAVALSQCACSPSC